MVLEQILFKLSWTPHGIMCPDVATAKLVHKFLREAVLDRHIYISKVIGYKIESSKAHRPFAGTYIARHKQIGESYQELVINMLDKVFVNSSSNYLDVVLLTGNNTLPESTFMDSNKYNVRTLYTNPTICRCLDKETLFKVKVQYDCGFRDMARNSKELDKEYFPCYTDFSLREFVRILPMQPDTTLVPIRYYNGMTEQDFKDILAKWFTYIQTKSIKEEENTWLQNFVR